MKRYILLVIILVLFCSLAVVKANGQQEPEPVTLSEFNRRTGDKSKTVLVYFHAAWCTVCARMQPLMQRVDSLYSSRLEILNIDTGRDKEMTEEFEIDALPVFMLYRKGTREWIHVGILNEKDLTDKLNEYVFAIDKPKH